MCEKEIVSNLLFGSGYLKHIPSTGRRVYQWLCWLSPRLLPPGCHRLQYVLEIACIGCKMTDVGGAWQLQERALPHGNTSDAGDSSGFGQSLSVRWVGNLAHVVDTYTLWLDNLNRTDQQISRWYLHTVSLQSDQISLEDSFVSTIYR